MIPWRSVVPCCLLLTGCGESLPDIIERHATAVAEEAHWCAVANAPPGGDIDRKQAEQRCEHFAALAVQAFDDFERASRGDREALQSLEEASLQAVAERVCREPESEVALKACVDARRAVLRGVPPA